MKKILLLLSLLLLASCSTLNNDSDETISETESTLPSEEEAEDETVSETESTLPGEDDTEDETTSEISQTTTTINTSNCPVGDGSGYPSPQDYEIDGQTINFTDTMLGSGKVGKAPYIQMAKETGKIKNVDPFTNCSITTKILINSNPYAGDMTHELTIKSGSVYGEYTNTLSATNSYRDDTYLYCEYTSTVDGDKYFDLSNISQYACYLVEIQFVWC